MVMLLEDNNKAITAHKTIPTIIQQVSHDFPSKIAIKHNNKSISFQELDRDSTRFALYLLKNHIQRKHVVAVVIPRSIDLVTCLLAIMKTGAAYLPIDPDLPPQRIEFFLKDSGCHTVITDYQQASKVGHHNRLIFSEAMFWSKTMTGDISYSLPIPTDLAYILYTSGTTGVPKGVKVTHANFLNLLLSIQKTPGISANDNMLAITTASFDISELEMFLPLLGAARMTIVDNDITKDGRALLEVIKNENITIVQATPFTWLMMIENGWDNQLPIKAFCGGEAMTRDLARKLCSRTNELWNMYGPTETTIYSIIKKISPEDKLIAIGRPIANTKVYLLDNNLCAVENGQEGEITISGKGVCNGYLNQEALTNSKFVDDPYSLEPGQKMYRTGDIGRMLDNGDIQYLGRLDEQIKIRGYRIEPEEIEFQLRKLPAIKEAIIQVFNDSGNNQQLVAYVVTDTNVSFNDVPAHIDEWTNTLKEVLPHYMLPNKFIPIPKIPLKPNGKLDKINLPNPEKNYSHLRYQSPHTELEKNLCTIWSDYFKKAVGVNENFFELGGNSLIATKIMVKIDRLIKKTIPISNLFKYPTAEALASFIQGSLDHTYKSLIPIKPTGMKLPLYIVHGIGLNLLHLGNMVNLLDESQPVYGLQHPGLDGTISNLKTIPEIASFYNSEIKHHNPNGPYLLAGFSFGGYLAFEMARQLISEGKEVKCLVLFDTVLQYPTNQYPIFKKILFKSLRQIFKAGFRLQLFFTHPVQNLHYLQYHYLKKLKSIFGQPGILKQYLINSPDYVLEIALSLEAAFAVYKVKPLDITIDLFKAGTRLYFVDDPEYYGWKKYALKKINVYTIPGDHNDIFNPPNVEILVDLLQKRLNEVNNK